MSMYHSKVVCVFQNGISLWERLTMTDSGQFCFVHASVYPPIQFPESQIQFPETQNTKIWQPPKKRTLPNFQPPKMGEGCLPTYLTFDMCPRVLWPSHVYILTLIGFIFDFRGPLCQNQSYKPVFSLLAPHSVSALFSRNSPTCARITLGAILGTFGIT